MLHLLSESRNDCVSFAAVSNAGSLVQEDSPVLIFLSSLIGPVYNQPTRDRSKTSKKFIVFSSVPSD
jgi:hypothetical protein